MEKKIEKSYHMYVLNDAYRGAVFLLCEIETYEHIVLKEEDDYSIAMNKWKDCEQYPDNNGGKHIYVPIESHIMSVKKITSEKEADNIFKQMVERAIENEKCERCEWEDSKINDLHECLNNM